MVIGDNFFSKSKSTKDDLFIKLPIAPAQERLGAIFLDVFLSLPVISLLVSPLTKKFTLARLESAEMTLTWITLSILLLVFLFTVLYQTIFVYYWGGTPGKKIMKLRVVSIWGQEKLTLMQAFLRSLFWSIETILLCMIPHLDVLSARYRRAVHDRVADTVVISKSAKVGEEPTVPEIVLARLAYVTVLLALISVVMVEFAHQYSKDNQSDFLTGELESSSFLCENVGEAQKQLSVEKDKPNRITTALILFLSDQLDTECLQKEADYELWHGGETINGYLARLFLEMQKPDTAESYLKKICEFKDESEACFLAKTIVEPKDSVLLTAAAKLQNHKSLLTKIWLIDFFSEYGLYKNALALIESTTPNRALGYFMGLHRVEALRALGYDDKASSISRVLMENLNDEQRLSFISLNCLESLDSGCNLGDSHYCTSLKSEVEIKNAVCDTPEMILSLIKMQECKGLSDDYLNKLSNYAEFKDGKRFIKAIADSRHNKYEGLKLYALSSEKRDIFSAEARRRLIRTLDLNDPSFKDLEAQWLQADLHSRNWRELGRELFIRYRTKGLHKESLVIASALSDKGNLSSRAPASKRSRNGGHNR